MWSCWATARSSSRRPGTASRCGWRIRRSSATAWRSSSTGRHATSDTAGVITRVGEGETITARERRDVILLAEHEEIAITRSRYGPGERGPDPHVHREHTDSFYVLEGELEFRLGPDGGTVRATAGTLVAVPAGLIHSFDQAGDTDARFLNFHA